MKKIICIGFVFGSLIMKAQESNPKAKEIASLTITSTKNNYKLDSSQTVSKQALKDIENPQVYNAISKQVLKDQVITNLNDALKNATGVSRLWESTGRGGDGAEFYSMRGFAVQPTMMNGMPAISNGTIDPVNVESIEAIKGPSGTLYGGSIISYGGLINIVTKKPFETFGGEVGYVTGSNGLNRFTADINTPLHKQVFARVNAAYHYEKSFQDAGFQKTFYVAPSIKIVASNKLSFLLNTEFKNAESANAPMLFLNRYAPLSFQSLEWFEKSYKVSYTSNDLTMKNPSFSMQAQALYTLHPNWTSQTLLSRSHTKTNGYYHYLWDASNGNDFTRFISKRNGETNTIDVQQNFIGNFTTGKWKHKFLVGFDYLQSQIENYSTGWEANGAVSLINQTDSGSLTTQGVDKILVSSAEGNSVAETKIASAYISDVIYFTPRLSAMLSLRVDNFTGKPLYANDEITSQTTLSPRLGIVYQPILHKVSVFGNIMNGFTNLAPANVSDISGNNPTLKIFKPEQANQWEIGAKANVYQERISITASYYSIVVSNKTMPDPNNVNNVIQGGQVESKGIEFSVITNPLEGLSIIAGVSHNKNSVTKDAKDGGYLGLRTEEAGPANLINFWANYKCQQACLKGFSVGLGGNYAGEHKTLHRDNIGTFTLPSYTVVNGLIAYATNLYSLNLKIDNIGNVKYYSGWSTVTPQRLRTISIGCTYKF
jgi:iron complex outermembrane receptor protein